MNAIKTAGLPMWRVSMIAWKRRSEVAVGGELSTRVGRLPAVRLGTFEISMPLTQFSRTSSGILATRGLAGIIGAQMLRRFTVIFDYTHREMILEPNGHFSEPPVEARNLANPRVRKHSPVTEPQT